MMEDVDAAGAAEQPALAAFGEEIGEFRYAGRGAWKPATSAEKSSALATSVISQRSGTARSGKASPRMRARSAAVARTERSPGRQYSRRAGMACVTPLQVTLPVAASSTKSYSLDLPAAMISRPRTSAQLASAISRLGWSPSTGVTATPLSRARRASPGPTTLSASFETSATWRLASIAARLCRVAASGLPVASTRSRKGSSITMSRLAAATHLPLSQAARAAAAVSQRVTSEAAKPAAAKARPAASAVMSTAIRALMSRVRRDCAR